MRRSASVLDSNPRTTQLLVYDSSYNRSSNVWCDGAIVIRRDSKVGPFIRRTSVLHDWLTTPAVRAGLSCDSAVTQAIRVDLCRTGWRASCLGRRAAAVEVFTLPNYEESLQRAEDKEI